MQFAGSAYPSSGVKICGHVSNTEQRWMVGLPKSIRSLGFASVQPLGKSVRKFLHRHHGDELDVALDWAVVAVAARLADSTLSE